MKLSYLHMRRLFIPLLAVLALPTAVNAESYWLVLQSGGNGKALEKIEMESMKQCKEQGEIYIEGLSGVKRTHKDYIYYVCLTGK